MQPIQVEEWGWQAQLKHTEQQLQRMRANRAYMSRWSQPANRVLPRQYNDYATQYNEPELVYYNDSLHPVDARTRRVFVDTTSNR